MVVELFNHTALQFASCYADVVIFRNTQHHIIAIMEESAEYGEEIESTEPDIGLDQPTYTLECKLTTKGI